MTLTVHTARVTYAGLDRLDVTRKSAGPDGLPFAPSWRILGPALTMRRRRGARALRSAWPGYVRDYTAEMRASYRDQRAAWDRLLARAEVTLVCYCTDPAHCHRTLLAGILEKLGAVNAGERKDGDKRKSAALRAVDELARMDPSDLSGALDDIGPEKRAALRRLLGKGKP